MDHYPTYLIHYGIQGQKWGVRRFQNEDGTWTADGLERRRKEDQKSLYKSIKKDAKKGTFDPKKYVDNDYIKSIIKKSKINDKMKEKDTAKKEYNKSKKEQEKWNKVISKRDHLAGKYYMQSYNPSMTADEKYNLSEQSRWKADDEFNKKGKYEKSFGKIDYRSLSKIYENEDRFKVKKREVWDEAYKISKEIAGEKYSSINIKSPNTKEPYIWYLDDIVAEAIKNTDYTSLRKTTRRT